MSAQTTTETPVAVTADGHQSPVITPSDLVAAAEFGGDEIDRRLGAIAHGILQEQQLAGAPGGPGFPDTHGPMTAPARASPTTGLDALTTTSASVGSSPAAEPVPCGIAVQKSDEKRDEEAAALVKTACELKEAGNALFSKFLQAGPNADSDTSSKLLKQALAKYTKIRLYTDALDPPNDFALPPSTEDSGAHKAEVIDATDAKDAKVAGVKSEDDGMRDALAGAKEGRFVEVGLMRKVRAVRLHGDLNSAICCFHLARLAKPGHNGKMLDKALFFAERASSVAPARMAVNRATGQYVAAEQPDRRKAVFWRGRILCRSGDTENAQRDLDQSLVDFAPGTPEHRAVLDERKILGGKVKEQERKERALFAGCFDRAKTTNTCPPPNPQTAVSETKPISNLAGLAPSPSMTPAANAI
jgi:hypothetical protein